VALTTIPSILNIKPLGNNIIEFKIYKDATSFDITGLKPSSSYSFQLFTKYGTDDNFVMSEPVTMSMTTTAERKF
jgi:hypothetical protein